MKLIIDIPEETYDLIKKYRIAPNPLTNNKVFNSFVMGIILNGTPLTESDDCVSREAVLDEIHKCLEERDYTLGTLYDNICELPSDTPKREQGDWIPVSEGLPDESCYCLCCDKDGYMTIGSINKYSKEWWFEDDEVDIDVVAWTPLPKPYKAESEE